MARRRGREVDVDDGPTAIFEARPHRDTKRGYDKAPEVQQAIRVISMKTPGLPNPADQGDDAKARAIKLRALSEISAPSINLPLGNLAPPRDDEASARRHLRGNAMIALATMAIGLVITVVIYVLARR